MMFILPSAKSELGKSRDVINLQSWMEPEIRTLQIPENIEFSGAQIR